jgi:hypothetical protein
MLPSVCASYDAAVKISDPVYPWHMASSAAHERAASIKADDVKRILANIDA